MTPKTTLAEPRGKRATAGGTAQRAPVPPLRQPQRRIVVIGAPSDIPRALDHPAIADGRFAADVALAVDVGAEDAFDVAARVSELLGQGGVYAMLMAGPVGPSVMRVVADLALLHHCELLAVMPTDVLADHDPRVVWSGDSPVVQLTRIPQRRWALALKRIIDVAGASAGLIVAAPVIAVLATLVCIESPGRPIFAHRRVGYRGKRFNCLKLRTMALDAEDQLKSDPALYEEYRRNHFKIPEDRDPRTTKLGKFSAQVQSRRAPPTLERAAGGHVARRASPGCRGRVAHVWQLG